MRIQKKLWWNNNRTAYKYVHFSRKTKKKMYSFGLTLYYMYTERECYINFVWIKWNTVNKTILFQIFRQFHHMTLNWWLDFSVTQRQKQGGHQNVFYFHHSHSNSHFIPEYNQKKKKKKRIYLLNLSIIFVMDCF